MSIKNCKVPYEERVGVTYSGNKTDSISIKQKDCEDNGNCWEKTTIKGVPWCYKSISPEKKHYLMYKIPKDNILTLNDSDYKKIKDNTHITLATFIIKIDNADTKIESDILSKIKKDNLYTILGNMYKSLNSDNSDLIYKGNTILPGKDKEHYVSIYSPHNKKNMIEFELKTVLILLQYINPKASHSDLQSFSIDDTKNIDKYKLTNIPKNCKEIIAYKYNKDTHIIFYLYQADVFHITLTSNKSNYSFLDSIKCNNIKGFLQSTKNFYT